MSLGRSFHQQLFERVELGRRRLALVDAAGILMGEGSLELKASRNSAIQMLDNPTNASDTPTATNLVSLFQANSTALMATQTVNWEVARAGSVLVIEDADY